MYSISKHTHTQNLFTQTLIFHPSLSLVYICPFCVVAIRTLYIILSCFVLFISHFCLARFINPALNFPFLNGGEIIYQNTTKLGKFIFSFYLFQIFSKFCQPNQQRERESWMVWVYTLCAALDMREWRIVGNVWFVFWFLGGFVWRGK